MPLITIKNHERVAVVRLDNGVPNAISSEVVTALANTVQQLRETSLGIVLTGNTKFFSMGFDLPELLRMDRIGMADFFHRFNQVVLAICSFPAPTAVATRGHAVAGGAILALAADCRFAASGEKKFGLNEVKLGLPVPYLADMMLRQITTERMATRMLYEGEFITATEAVGCGIVDGIFPDKYVEDEAVRHVDKLAELPRHAFTAIKENRIESLEGRYCRNGAAKDEFLLDCWFSPQTQEYLHRAAEKFR